MHGQWDIIYNISMYVSCTESITQETHIVLQLVTSANTKTETSIYQKRKKRKKE